jgi:hypothetical protein
MDGRVSEIFIAVIGNRGKRGKLINVKKSCGYEKLQGVKHQLSA